MSHSSRQKLFVKELKSYLPEHIDLWIDEKQLLIGDDFGATIKKTIEEEVDFLILVIDNNALESEWVIREFNWGLKREDALGRTFVLPILLEKDAWNKLTDENIKKRKYIHCLEFTDSAIKSTAADLINELFAQVCKQLKGNLKLNQKNLQSNSLRKQIILPPMLLKKYYSWFIPTGKKLHLTRSSY